MLRLTLLLCQVWSFKIYSVCCIFCGFWQTYWDTCHYNIINNSVTVRMSLLCSSILCPLRHWSSYCGHHFPFQKHVIAKAIQCAVSLDQPFLVVACIRGFHACFRGSLLFRVLFSGSPQFVCSLTKTQQQHLDFLHVLTPWKRTGYKHAHRVLKDVPLSLFHVHKCFSAWMFVQGMCSCCLFMWKWTGAGSCETWVTCAWRCHVGTGN